MVEVYVTFLSKMFEYQFLRIVLEIPPCWEANLKRVWEIIFISERLFRKCTKKIKKDCLTLSPDRVTFCLALVCQ